jgi:magnesium transporter
MVAANERERFRVRRFDADRQDRELTLVQALQSSPGERQLLWIDVAGEIEADDMEAIGKRFEFDGQTREALAHPIDGPHLAVHGSYFHLSVAAEPDPATMDQAVWLEVVGGRNVVVTRHETHVKLLDDIDERIKADTTLGAVEAAEFVALLLESVVTSYFAAVDEIEDEIDELDSRSLRETARRLLLDDLVRVRRRISRLRRVVTSHRTVFSALAGPDMRQVVGSEDASADLQAVASRYAAAVAAVEATRDSLLGSFDIYMTRTAQRTNDVMKILTIATVLLLPGTVVAGLLGMNVVVPLNKDDPLSFWIVVAGVVTLAVVVLATARRRRWL